MRYDNGKGSEKWGREGRGRAKIMKEMIREQCGKE